MIILGDGAVLAPGAVVRHVQVDPRVQAVPRLGIELHVVMPLFQHLHQFARAGMILQRLLQEVIALGARPAYVGVQGHIGTREAEMPLALPLAQGQRVVLATEVGPRRAPAAGLPSWQPTQYLSNTG